MQENGSVEPARSELSVRADASGKQRLGLSTPTPAYEQMRKQRLGLMIPTKTKAGAIDPHASLRANEKTKAGAHDPHASKYVKDFATADSLTPTTHQSGTCRSDPAPLHPPTTQSHGGRTVQLQHEHLTVHPITRKERNTNVGWPWQIH